jgi:6-phosphogluconolactonase
MCELDGTVEVLIYDGLGSFELMQKITTLPGGVIPEGYLGAAAIRLSKDGKFLYTSNRGFDAITVFEIAADGTLALAQIIETQGSVCRDFNLTTDNNWLIAGHQNSDNITVFKRDSETGLLSLISSDFVVPECVNVAVK